MEAEGGGGGERVSKGGTATGRLDRRDGKTDRRPETAHYGRRMREECGGSGLLSRYNKYRIGDRIGSAGSARRGPTYRSWRRAGVRRNYTTVALE